ncbi:hypothetical protein BH23CHL2_BH23CHL2_28050 [soil metagenome]
MNPEIQIRHDLRPGDLGLVTMMHGVIYTREHGFNHIFEAYVGESLAEFGKQYDPSRDRLWIAETEGEFAGSIGILGREDNHSQLRWMLVDASARGQGLGRRLLGDCIEFAAGAGYDSIYLWTVHALEPAARLYRAAGFEMTGELPPSTLWGPELREQRYDLQL